MSELFYNFMLGENNAGYSYLRVDSTSLFSHTHFKLPTGDLVTNVFKLSLSNQQIMTCQHNDLPEVNMSQLPPNHYPGCAYPLLITGWQEDHFNYIQVSEDDGSITGECTLKKENSDVVEWFNNRIARRFTFQNDVVVKIDWGGAISHLCSTAEVAIQGSEVAFVVEEADNQ